MEKQKRPVLDTAKGKLQIEAESNQKKLGRDLKVARKTTKMATRKHRTHCESLRRPEGSLEDDCPPKDLEKAWNRYEI